MSAWPTMTVHWTKLVSPKSVLIHASMQCVERGRCAKWNCTLLFATVHLVFKEMKELHALRSNAPQTMTVLAMKYVITQGAAREGNACLSVCSLSVPLVPFAQPPIMLNNAPADPRCKEMVIQHALSVSRIFLFFFLSVSPLFGFHS